MAGKVKKNPGMAKLKKVAPKVAKQMGYKKGGSVSSASKRQMVLHKEAELKVVWFK
jgi:hypothetical protein